MRDGPLSFRGEEGLSNFPQKVLYNKHNWKKLLQSTAMGKNWTSAFYYSGPVFDFKKFLGKLLPTKEIMHILMVHLFAYFFWSPNRLISIY